MVWKTAEMKSVQDETQKTVSDFASRTLTHQETSQCTERDIDLQKNLLNKGFYQTNSQSIPLGVPHRRLADCEGMQTIYCCKLNELTNLVL